MSDFHSVMPRDRVVWKRAAGDVLATVLAISADRKRIQLQVDGWLGATWEDLDWHITYAPVADQKKRKTLCICGGADSLENCL